MIMMIIISRWGRDVLQGNMLKKKKKWVKKEKHKDKKVLKRQTIKQAHDDNKEIIKVKET